MQCRAWLAPLPDAVRSGRTCPPSQDFESPNRAEWTKRIRSARKGLHRDGFCCYLKPASHPIKTRSRENKICQVLKGEEDMRYLHTMLRVRNLDAALKFYRDAMGLKEVRRIENDKGKFTLVFLCAPEDEALLKSLPQTRGAPLV